MTRLLGASRALARASFARPASALAANSGLDSEAEGTVNKLLARWDEYKASNTTHVAPMSSMSSHPDVLLSEKPKVVLLEGIHEAAVAMFEARGMDVTSYSKALEGDELLEVAADCHLLGIRSKTQLSAEFFDRIGKERHRLWTVGVLLHRHEPGGLQRGGAARRRRFQRAVLQHALRRREDAGRGHCALAPFVRALDRYA